MMHKMNGIAQSDGATCLKLSWNMSLSKHYVLLKSCTGKTTVMYSYVLSVFMR